MLVVPVVVTVAVAVGVTAVDVDGGLLGEGVADGFAVERAGRGWAGG